MNFRSVRRSLIVFIVSIACFSILPGCQKVNSKPAKIRLAINPVPQNALVLIAIEKGYFKDEGLDVEVSKFTTGKLAFDAVLGGAADIATVADLPIMYAIMSGQKPAVFTTVERSGKSIKVLARADKGIKQPADLRGKKIATFKGSSAEFFLNRFLQKYGMTQKDVEVVQLTPPDMLASISKGDIDAMCIWEHFIYNAKATLKKQNQEAVVFVEPEIYTETANVATREDYFNKSKPVIDAFMKALRRSEQLVTQNQIEAQNVVAEFVQLDPTVLKGIWNDFDFKLGLEPKLAEQLKDEAQFAINAGTLQNNSVIADFRPYLHVD